ncbi:hypothetical protein JTE90_009619 [Oedothorax gibbosus]|uniref:Uncharacterized protein n=1 Tax=Oedothorax gibbosus TaxID=931172 RepID=A0AAV6THZ3_9ARAC|nr:hypothetical protein JTE90_009619 [Oedothorax gibbosus]
MMPPLTRKPVQADNSTPTPPKGFKRVPFSRGKENTPDSLMWPPCGPPEKFKAFLKDAFCSASCGKKNRQFPLRRNAGLKIRVYLWKAPSVFKKKTNHYRKPSGPPPKTHEIKKSFNLSIPACLAR